MRFHWISFWYCMVDQTPQQQSSRRVRLPVWAAVLVFLATAIVLIGSGVWLFTQVRGMVGGIHEVMSEPPPIGEVTKEVEGQEDSAEPPLNPVVIVTRVDPDDPDKTIEVEVTVTPDTASLFDLSQYAHWEGTERINILLLGIDSRCDEEGPTRTDSMMLISIDPVNQTTSALSIPRDTWVEIPIFGADRINRAHYFGEANEYPGGGPQLAMETVENFLGIHVDHFIGINFEAFRDFINLIDGIQIDVPEAVDDPTYPDECYGYDPFRVSAGVQSMNGPIALQYARTRATAGGDIDRAARQQQVIFAVRQKLLDLGMIPKLILRAPQLWDSFERNVQTSLSQKEVIQLALLVQDIPAENIQMSVIDYNYVYNATTPNGEQVLIPDYDKISELRDELFSAVTAPQPIVNNLTQHVIDEDARVVIWNGTQTRGLASETQTYLESYGLNIAAIDNADTSQYPTTRVFDYGSNEYTRRYLTEIMGLRPLDVVQAEDPPEGDFDVLVILGLGWEVPSEDG